MSGKLILFFKVKAPQEQTPFPGNFKHAEISSARKLIYCSACRLNTQKKWRLRPLLWFYYSYSARFYVNFEYPTEHCHSTRYISSSKHEKESTGKISRRRNSTVGQKLDHSGPQTLSLKSVCLWQRECKLTEKATGWWCNRNEMGSQED